jgi:hypothetical protein
MKADSFAFVTAYFPIRTSETGRSIYDYLANLDLLANIVYPFTLYIYLDHSLRDLRIILPNTHCILCTLDDIPTYELVKSSFANFHTINESGRPVELRDPRYLGIQYGKFYLLNKTFNDFPGYSYLAWIDAGTPRFTPKIDVHCIVDMLQDNKADLFCQINLLPYPFYYLRTLTSRLDSGLSAVAGGFFIISNKASFNIYHHVVEYLANSISGLLPLHNEQIFLSCLSFTRQFNRLLFIRTFSSNHLECLVSPMHKVPQRGLLSVNRLLSRLRILLFSGFLVWNPTVIFVFCLSLFAYFVQSTLRACLSPISLLQKRINRLIARRHHSAHG